MWTTVNLLLPHPVFPSLLCALSSIEIVACCGGAFMPLVLGGLSSEWDRRKKPRAVQVKFSVTDQLSDQLLIQTCWGLGFLVFWWAFICPFYFTELASGSKRYYLWKHWKVQSTSTTVCPFIYCLLYLSSMLHSFQCTSLSLTYSKGFYSFWCSCKWDFFFLISFFYSSC